MKGKSARQKGHKYENELVRLFRDIVPEHVGTVSRGRNQDAAGPVKDPDVDMPFFRVEAKRHKKVAVKSALLQCIVDAESAKDSRLPVAVCKDDARHAVVDDAVVVMRLRDFVRVVEVFVQHNERLPKDPEE